MRPRILLLLPSLCLALCAGGAAAESSFLLAYPSVFGTVGAATYDEGGTRIGGADLLVERLDSGRVRMRSESGDRDGAQTVAIAELTPVDANRGLRVIRQESRSLDPAGKPLGVLTIDHVRRIARCQDPTGAVVSELALPEADRVLNVPMNLFFQPLVSGEQSSLEFQLFLCRPNAQLMDFEAWAVKRDGDAPIEVRYGPDFGLASALARQMAPKLSFWFDDRFRWVGHRLPLYSGGPEVMVVRDDVPSASLLD